MIHSEDTKFVFKYKKEMREFCSQKFSHSVGGVYKEENGIIHHHWHSNDSEESFKENLTKYPELLKYYIDNPVKYVTNNDFYRCNYNFTVDKGKKVDVALGCSMTFGIGLENKFLWPTLLKNYLGKEVINLGVPGGGIDSSYISLNKILEYYDVENVYLHMDLFPRFLIYQPYNDRPLCTILANMGWENIKLSKIYHEHYFKTAISDPKFMTYNHVRGLDAIKGLCLSKGIKLFSFAEIYDNTRPFLDKHSLEDISYLFYFYKDYDSGETMQRQEVKPNDIVARDLHHPGPLYQETVFKTFKLAIEHNEQS